MPLFNRHQQRNTVEQLVEEYTHFRITRRQFMQRALAAGVSTSAAVALLDACGGPPSSSGSGGGINVSGTPPTVKSLDMLVVISGSELDNLNAVNDAFTSKTGIKVNVESTRDLPTVLSTRVRGNNPPDISAIHDLPSITTYANEGKLLRLDSFLDMNSLKANYASTWLNLVTVNGGMYAVPYLANTKGTIWYSPKEFQANGWSVPKTWNDLITLSQQIAASGKFPWAMGVESGAASGWPAADWIDQIYLTLNGPQMSDKWVNHQIPWTDSSVKTPLSTLVRLSPARTSSRARRSLSWPLTSSLLRTCPSIIHQRLICTTWVISQKGSSPPSSQKPRRARISISSPGQPSTRLTREQ